MHALIIAQGWSWRQIQNSNKIFRVMGVKARIGVIGGNICSSEIAQTAEAVGAEIARRGAVLICGGLTGVMEAACRGAKSAGGTTIGILPGFDAAEANAYVDIPIVTGMSYARNLIIVRSCEAIIAIDGRYGTLSELAFALQLKKPVIGLALSWEISPEIIKARSPKEAVELAFQAINPQRRKDA